jgi:hypothetical protein
MDPRFRTPGKRGVCPKLPPLELGVRVFTQEQQTLRIRTVCTRRTARTDHTRLFGCCACGSVQRWTLLPTWLLTAGSPSGLSRGVLAGPKSVRVRRYLARRARARTVPRGSEFVLVRTLDPSCRRRKARLVAGCVG